MSLAAWLTFLVAAVLISVSPGAGAINTMSNGMRYGVRRSLPAIMGLQLGFGIQILLVGAGLGAIIASSNIALSVIKWLGVAYLIWLGISKWREPVMESMDDDRQPVSGYKRFWNAVFVNLTNPKATVFLVALFPQFLAAGRTPWPAVAHHGHHTDSGGLPGNARLRPAGKPAVPVYDHSPAPAANEPGVWRAVRHGGCGPGQLQTRLISD